MRALFYNESGVLIAAYEVPLTSRALSPGETLEFVLPISEALVYDRVSFQVRGRGFRPQVQRFSAPSNDSPADQAAAATKTRLLRARVARDGPLTFP